MVLTALFLRPRKTIESTPHDSLLFRSIGLALVLICLPLFTACGAGGDAQNGSVTANPGNGKGHGYGSNSGSSGGSTASTVAVSLAWDTVNDPSVMGYFLYYGTQSPNSLGSCTYAQSTFITSPMATVDGLTPNTTYFFAVSAYNGLQSLCSAEVSTVT